MGAGQVGRRAVVLGVVALTWLAGPARATDYPREHIYDTSVGQDEAAVNVSLTSNRWPDCTTLESTIEGIFRLEGVADRAKSSDQARALALWKWFRILVSATGGHYAYEGPPGAEKIVYDPHKIFAVYGHHQCDGQSWAMVPLWRAAGYMAFDECHNGHTVAALRYRDSDGIVRYHNFDPQGRYYHWDPVGNRVSCWSMPVMTGHVFRHVMTPQNVHTMRTSLRIGETVERNWTNTGHIVPHGTPTQRVGAYQQYYDYVPGRSDGVYASAGEEVQTLTASTDPALFRSQLYEGSDNVACSPAGGGKASLHPAEPGRPGVFIYRLAPPYVIVDATIEATLVKSADKDLCRLSISRDGRTWQPVFEKDKPGVETVKLDVGRSAREKNQPDVYTAYDLFVRAEFQAVGGDVRAAGMNGLKVIVHRMLNKRALPNLMPGENFFRVTADRMASGRALNLVIRYEANGKPVELAHRIATFPFYFRINADFELRKISNYDKDFNNEAIRMVGYSMALGPMDGGPPGKSLPPAEVEPRFSQSFPHPGDMTDRKVKKPGQEETDPMQTSGFFPQSRTVVRDKAKMDELIEQTTKTSQFAQYRVFQELGNHPEAVDFLIEQLPKANIDGTLFIVKALAQIGDPKAIDPLLTKWNRGMGGGTDGAGGGAPRGAPGTRYIPDALSEIAVRTGKVDERIVPALVRGLPQMRFDYCFHVAHALGELGRVAPPDSESRKLAEKWLKDLAETHWFGPVREEAAAGLKKLSAGR